MLAPDASATTCENAVFRTGLSANLPDCRAYELVTPAEKGITQDLFGEGSVSTPVIAASSGNRIAMEGLAAFEPGPSPGLASSYVFSRTASGWAMTSLTPPGTEPAAGSYIFNPDLSQIAFKNLVLKSIDIAPSEQSFEVGPVGGPYPYETVATTPFPGGRHPFPNSDALLGASSDFSRIILGSTDHMLLSGTPTGTDSGAYDLYEWVSGGLKLINVKSGSVIGKCGATLGYGVYQGGGYPEFEVDLANQAISADGSKLFFTSPDPIMAGTGEEGCFEESRDGVGANPPRLYMHMSETAGGPEETVEVSEPEKVFLSKEEEEMPVVYQGASVNGSKVFFTTERALTPEASGKGGRLYEYDTEAPEGERLKLIFESEGLTAMSYGTVFLSEDGAVVYFYTNQGDVLYRYEAADGGSVRAVATMKPPAGGKEAPYSTPNGESFLFASEGVDGEPRGEGHNELYLYSHATSSVVCVSCGAGDAPAEGEVVGARHFGSEMKTPDRTPELIPMSDDGRYVFFNSTSSLVPQAMNSSFSNVYEWEADGSGTCTESVGCTYLISQGNSDINSDFLGASADGSNVFFGTHAQLVPQDIDASGDIYDARIDGGFPPQPSGTGLCEGDACVSPPTAPNDPTPASSSPGPGNPPPLPVEGEKKSKGNAKRCAKGTVLKRGRCAKRRATRETSKQASRPVVAHSRGDLK